jgi:copper chaperone CopZ
MKHILPLSLVVLLIAASCAGNGEKKIISVEKKIVLKAPAKVAVNRELAVKVAGMSCEHACGGAIRMALKETGAVDRCSFDFKTDRAVNTAFITFDKDKISADKILAIIQQINDGQFTTSAPETRMIEEKATTSDSGTGESSEKSEKSMVKEIGVSTTSFEFPNLFELFSRLVS